MSSILNLTRFLSCSWPTCWSWWHLHPHTPDFRYGINLYPALLVHFHYTPPIFIQKALTLGVKSLNRALLKCVSVRYCRSSEFRLYCHVTSCIISWLGPVLHPLEMTTGGKSSPDFLNHWSCGCSCILFPPRHPKMRQEKLNDYLHLQRNPQSMLVRN